jgi:peptide deformylase
MTVLRIARMGNPVLRRRADEIDDPGAPDMRQLVADMIETMIAAPGVGLAAPQVEVGRRVLVFQVPAGRREPDEPPEDLPGPDNIAVLINPEITPLDDTMVLGWEACLSIPGLVGRVPRHRRIRYRGVTPEGETVEREASGFHARVVQHEVDHLDGILFMDRMSDLRTLAFDDELHYLMQRTRTE